ncbi:MAG: hypothetical protein KDC66_13955 [Phaeodactylibacter sp.]|nr:hypothetical protein [Phaeodactylibacter sp.]MCB9274387.1 hypothetical protein [Lewinellaceae bacterium]
MQLRFFLFLIALMIPALHYGQSQKVSLKALQAEVTDGKPIMYKKGGAYFTGTASQYYPAEGVTMDYYIEDGYVSRMVSWKDSGSLERDFHYRKGVLHGKVTGYFDNGQKYYEDNYENGLRQGIQHGWFSDGTIRLKSEFINGFEIMRFEFNPPKGVLALPAKLSGC